MLGFVIVSPQLVFMGRIQAPFLSAQHALQRYCICLTTQISTFPMGSPFPLMVVWSSLGQWLWRHFVRQPTLTCDENGLLCVKQMCHIMNVTNYKLSSRERLV